MTQEKQYLVCRVEDIDSPGSIGFSLEHEGQNHECFIVRNADAILAFRNQCPHTGANLNWLPDQFLTSDAEFIQCSIHGALFRLNDGLCIHGPCVGQSLETLPCEVRTGQIFVELCT